MGWWAAIPAVASLVGSALNYKASKRGAGGGGGGGENPYQEGMGYLNQIPGATEPYFKPFIEGGREASGMVNPIYERMSRSPGAFIEELMQGYTPSRGYQFKQREMEKAMRNSASHGGFVGTPYNQMQQSELVQGLLGNDMQEFLQNLFGIQQTGLQGQENRINRGYGASGDYGDIIGSSLANKAFLGASGRAQQMDFNQASRNSRSKFLSQMLGAGGSLGKTIFENKFGGGAKPPNGYGSGRMVEPYQMGNNAF